MSVVASLLDGALALPASAVAGRTIADPDEDAVTLAAEAAMPLIERSPEPPSVLVLATTSPSYAEGGNVQLLAELLGLAGELVALELTSSLRDGLAAARVAAALVADDDTEAIVCAAHLRGDELDGGDGAVALRLGRSGGAATLRFGPARAEELRDRWRLAGEAESREGDPSWAWNAGAPRVARDLEVDGPAVVGPVARPAARAEAALESPRDELAPVTGILGTAHALARVLLALDRPQVVVAASGGLAETVTVEPGDGAAAIAQAAQAAFDAPRLDDEPPALDWSALDPYTSGPRSWRERGQDLRLEGARCGSCGRVTFPPPPSCPVCSSRELTPERLSRNGTVVTFTRDHVYPVGATTGMAVVELDGGARFYGQVVPSGSVDIGSRVRLVPRRLHDGGGAAQYFWKIAPEDGA